MVTRFLVDLVHLSLGPTALGLKCTKSTRNLEPMLYLLPRGQAAIPKKVIIPHCTSSIEAEVALYYATDRFLDTEFFPEALFLACRYDGCPRRASLEEQLSVPCFLTKKCYT